MLIGALSTSGSGVMAASTYLDTAGNNIANSNTTGYKTQTIAFQDLFYTGLAPGTATSQNTRSPTGAQIGSGVNVSSIGGLFTQGTLAQTGRQFDLAISGQGFFPVSLGSGQTGYTRAGNFTTNANGQLVSSDGFLLGNGSIKVPSNASAVTVSGDGTVTATTPAGQQVLGTLTLTQFTNPEGLTRIGDTTFVAGPDSGAPVTGAPGTGGLGTITQGSLEQSNVDLPTELVNLIIAQSSFDYNTNALQVENETLQATVALIP
ncbi:Flagellar basal-body rod protein FlgG [Frigoriglobus tundricola]|uniref:Flagellar basal-body rod protein FlgG n=2 Tax=Frigoriglobus tundricola TaxID=2774151 RepID=A0A6M5YWU6_9BACT|nr:Flagellar basal-body rod protein FlgG [Frigoriglobus tundricola]